MTSKDPAANECQHCSQLIRNQFMKLEIVQLEDSFY